MDLRVTARANGRRRLVAVAVVLLLMTFAVQLSGTPARAADPHWCGSSCNGKNPRDTVTLLDGTRVRCSDSARHVWGPQHPWAFKLDGTNVLTRDAYMTVWHTYSGVCQTTWLSVQSTKAIGRTGCLMRELRTADPRFQAEADCPVAGTTTVTPMVDDHDAQARAIAYGHIGYRIPFAQDAYRLDTNYY